MSLKRSNSSSSQPPNDATNSQPAKKIKKAATVVLPDDAWSRIVPYVDSETLRAIACASKTTRDAAVFRDVEDGSFSLLPTTERHSGEFATKKGYSAYFQELFCSSTCSEVCSHQKWEGWFAQLDDVGRLKGEVPTGVTASVLRLLKYGNVARFEALAKLCESRRCSGSPPWRGGGGCLGRSTRSPSIC